MKLNHDCVRSVLLAIEDTEFEDSITIDYLKNKLNDFSEEEIIYTCLKLHEANYIEAITVPRLKSHLPGINRILQITWDGHQFLDTIRDNEVWSTTKTVLSKVSSASLTFASSVASQVLTNMISKSMGF